MIEEPIGSLGSALDPSLLIQGLAEITLSDFWKWAYSDVLVNTIRAVFGEFLVASALGVEGKPRVDWDSVDLRVGSSTIEVKTASEFQAWPHPEGVKPSPPRFDIGRHEKWDGETGEYSTERARWSDCYVFCLYGGPERQASTNLERRLAVLDSANWQFHVASTREVEQLGDQKSIGLKGIAARWPGVAFHELREAVHAALKT